jgi:hypothetical protein
VIRIIKKAVIEVVLVEESVERTNREIEEEIFEELSKNLHVIPWAAEIKKVTVTKC